MDDSELTLVIADGLKKPRRRRRAVEVCQPIGDDLWRYERAALAQGFRRIAGVDEAGRGPLAGPVVAACVILPPAFDLDGVNDSKKLSEPQRERAYERIRAEAVSIGVGMADSGEVDSLNILKASWEAMRRAICSLDPELAPDLLLVDGLAVPGLPCANSWPIVGGDAASVSIAASSIIAKVTRDRMMVEYDLTFPGYGFAKHKGYGSAVHREALQRLGPCPIHRRTFAPVADCISALHL